MNTLDKILATAKRTVRGRFFKRGLPFISLILILPLGVQKFANLRYEYSKGGAITFEEAEKQGIKMKKPGEVTLETEFNKVKNLDIDNWEPIRIPRPWDETIE
ncbi:cytochrome c oxidase assembly protein COX16 homolog l(3)neo43 [Arctopsyche grandis]|uniref:cytochrome c oxidase assembly protein COX16 homolog l(3)neo43 n=1 Tax=Arctopsyche grandis TaxID=121162 RepID=UPI00406D7242